MSIRYAARRDAAEPAIVAALRAAGASVEIISNGDGLPDLMVGYRGVTYHLEVKNPTGPRGGKSGGGASRPGQGGDGVLTRDQRAWWAAWRGAPPVIVRTPVEALAAIGVNVSEAAGSPVEDKPGPAHAEGGGHDRAGASRRPATSQSRIEDREGHALPEPAASTYLGLPLPKLLWRKCRCGFEYSHMTGMGRGRPKPPPHSVSEADQARGLLCPGGAKVPAAPAKEDARAAIGAPPPKPMCPGAGRDATPVTTPAWMMTS